MTAGIRIKNASSIVQIDDRYKNLGVWQNGVAYGSQTSGYGDPVRYVAMITVQDHPSALFAYRCAGAVCSLWRKLSNSNGTATYQVICQNQTTPIEWIVFADPALCTPIGSAGIRIKNSSNGTVSFDSRLRYMRVLGTVQVGHVFESGGPTVGSTLMDVTYNGANLFVVQNNTAKQLDVSQVTQPGQPIVTRVIYFNTNFYWRNTQSVYAKVDNIFAAQYQNPPIQFNAAYYSWFSVFLIDCNGFF